MTKQTWNFVVAVRHKTSIILLDLAFGKITVGDPNFGLIKTLSQKWNWRVCLHERLHRKNVVGTKILRNFAKKNSKSFFLKFLCSVWFSAPSIPTIFTRIWTLEVKIQSGLTILGNAYHIFDDSSLFQFFRPRNFLRKCFINKRFDRKVTHFRSEGFFYVIILSFRSDRFSSRSHLNEAIPQKVMKLTKLEETCNLEIIIFVAQYD